MATRTITVHDRCTGAGCARVLVSISEGERGKCSSCWFKSLPPDTKSKMNKLIASAFNGASEEDKDKAVDDVLGVVRNGGI